jgi:hypothetical protein
VFGHKQPISDGQSTLVLIFASTFQSLIVLLIFEAHLKYLRTGPWAAIKLLVQNTILVKVKP